MAERLRSASQFYRFLWEIRGELFADGFEEELIASYRPRGQEPCPPALLAMVMLLQRYADVSDADAVGAAENDLRWQLVLGTLDQESAPFGQGTLVRFRLRMIANDLDKKLVERTVELAKKTKKFGWKKLRVALDSSPLHGAGRVEDTWNLIGRAMSKVVHAIALALDVDEQKVIEQAGLTTLTADSVKAAIDIDWGDEDAEHAALQRLLREVSALESWVARRASAAAKVPPLCGALEVLRKVVGQDIEPDPSGGYRIRDGVAEDRLISLGDQEMRHGRKSRTKQFNGYKRHIAIVDGLILATAVEPANAPEHVPTARLLHAVEQHGRIQALDIDRGYLPSSAVVELHRRGVAIHSRTYVKSNEGRFTKYEFKIDLRRKVVTCPASVSTPITPSGYVKFDVADCSSCKLKPSCTTGPARSIKIHRAEDLLIKLRRENATAAGRAVLRERVAVEHRLARVGAIQGDTARYKGVRKNELDLNRVAAIANLLELGRLRAA